MMASNNKEMRNGQAWLRQNVKSSSWITRQVKLSNAMAGLKKQLDLNPPKNMSKLYKVLTSKNQKAKYQNTNGFNEISGRDNFQEISKEKRQIYLFRDPFIVNERYYQNKDQLEGNIQPNYNIASIEISRNEINQKIKKVLAKCQFVNKTAINKKRLISRGQQSKNVAEQFDQSVVMKSVENEYSNLSSIFDQNHDRLGKIQKQKKKEQKLYVKQICSQQRVMDDGIRNYLIQLINKSQMCDLLSAKKYGKFKQLKHKLSQGEVFIMFVRQLLKRILQQEDMNPDIFSTSFNTMTKRYFAKYVSHKEKQDMYIKIRQQKMYKLSSPNGSNDGIILNQNDDQQFWIRCLMLFFSQSHSHQQLIQLLEKNDQQLMISAIEDFYHHNDIKNKAELQSNHLFSYNTAYRILVKILINHSLIQSEYQILQPEEKDIMILIKLWFVDGFYRTMEFKEAQENKLNILKQAISNQNKGKAQDALKKILSFLSFDQIFFEYFLPNRRSITDFHLLLLLKTLLSHPMLLKHSIYPIKSWVYQLISVLKSMIKSRSFQNDDKSIVMIIKIMQILRNFLDEKEFQEQLQRVLLIRKELLRNIMDQKFNFIEIVQKEYDIKFGFIESVIIKSLQTNQDEKYFMEAFLSSYLKDLNKQNVENGTEQNQSESESEETCDSLSNVDTEDFKCYGWVEQLKQSENRTLFKILNKQFLLGLKLANLYLLKLINPNDESEYQNKVHYCLKVFSKTKRFLSKFNNIFIVNKDKNENLSQISTNCGETVLFFEASIQQANMFLENACSLLEIGEFLISFIGFHQHLDHRNMEATLREINFIQHLESKYENLAVVVRNLCENFEKFSIADKSFGQTLLCQYSEMLIKSVENIDAKKLRRIRSLGNDFNGPMIMEFVNRFSSIVKQSQILR